MYDMLSLPSRCYVRYVAACVSGKYLCLIAPRTTAAAYLDAPVQQFS